MEWLIVAQGACSYPPLAYNNAHIFIETPIFTRQVKELVDDDQYRPLQLRLVLCPDEGDLIPGGGGLRKIRMQWRAAGSGAAHESSTTG
jgi:hypothetical protein